jgi:hypothetical protein
VMTGGSEDTHNDGIHFIPTHTREEQDFLNGKMTATQYFTYVRESTRDDASLEARTEGAEQIHLETLIQRGKVLIAAVAALATIAYLVAAIVFGLTRAGVAISSLSACTGVAVGLLSIVYYRKHPIRLRIGRNPNARY